MNKPLFVLALLDILQNLYVRSAQTSDNVVSFDGLLMGDNAVSIAIVSIDDPANQGGQRSVN